jgi:hypothetical protein
VKAEEKLLQIVMWMLLAFIFIMVVLTRVPARVYERLGMD